MSIKDKIKEKFIKNEIKLDNEDKLNIDEAMLQKSSLLLELGILSYEKIRNSEIEDEDFEQLCLQIIKIDKIIYENNKQIEKIKEDKKEIICECGHSINKNNKFCGECGRKTELDNLDQETKICNVCNNEIQIEFKYCECCGNKMIEK